jgi:hypothetical protein
VQIRGIVARLRIAAMHRALFVCSYPQKANFFLVQDHVGETVQGFYLFIYLFKVMHTEILNAHFLNTLHLMNTHETNSNFASYQDV